MQPSGTARMNESSLPEKFKQKLDFIGYELHDGVCQHIATAIAMLDGVCRRKINNHVDDSNDVAIALKYLHRALEELRRMICGLYPLQLDENGILKSIENMIAEMQSTNGPEIEFCHDGDFELLSESWQMTIFRIVQECLTNACRHSHSRHILIGLVHDQDCITIQVQDWGGGFDSTEAKCKGYGLRSIRHSVESLGGTILVDTYPGKGTCIMAEIHLSGHATPPVDGDF
jgi:two-component system, NarL family, sensor histidine kinase DegS